MIDDGYYEWLRQGKSKPPEFVRGGRWQAVRAGRPVGVVEAAGLGGDALESCSLITTNANELQSQIHDRMPVILDEADYATWLDPDVDDRQTLESLLVPFDSARMTARPVSTYVNNARNEGAECLAKPSS